MTGPATGTLGTFLDERAAVAEAFFAVEAGRLAHLCHGMAERFARGGRLVAVGSEPAARSDVRHVAVEFVHPVIVGKRALPAIGLVGDRAELRTQVELLLGEADILMAFGPRTDAASELAADRGCLIVGLDAPGGETFSPPSEDPFVRQELIETLYHVLWELVHVFFEHRGLLRGRDARPIHDAGASSFLYPFLDEREDRLEPVIADVERSVLAKAHETSELRIQTIQESGGVLAAAAETLRDAFDAGGTVLALGNGGSATDATDFVADFRSPPGGRIARAALDLAEDPAILTAIANDVGIEAIFLRQVIAYGRPGDVLVAFSTSGNSRNVIAALAQARAAGLRTIAMVGYDGGAVLADALADHVIVTRSEHIPRIQEAQATASHALRELVG